MTPRDRIERAARLVARVSGGMALVVEARRGLTTRAIRGWRSDLDRAREDLEAMDREER